MFRPNIALPRGLKLNAINNKNKIFPNPATDELKIEN